MFSNSIPDALEPKEWASTVQLLEVNSEKKIVWASREWARPPLGPAFGFQLLDNQASLKATNSNGCVIDRVFESPA